MIENPRESPEISLEFLLQHKGVAEFEIMFNFPEYPAIMSLKI